MQTCQLYRKCPHGTAHVGSMSVAFISSGNTCQCHCLLRCTNAPFQQNNSTNRKCRSMPVPHSRGETIDIANVCFPAQIWFKVLLHVS